ncbi:MAG: hypothetical protein WA962_13890 [Ornithinimicrobium sp.]
MRGNVWRLLDPTADFTPYFPQNNDFDSLVFDGEQWQVRACGLDMRATGTGTGYVEISGDWESFPDPDPGASCVYEPNAAGWIEFLESGPTIHRSGETLVLRRPLEIVSWQPGEAIQVPYDLDTVPIETTDDNESWAKTLYAAGPHYDYAPLESPQDALIRADAVIAGEIVGTQWTPGFARDDVHVKIEVDVHEILSDSSASVDPTDRIVVSLARSASARETVENGPYPGGPVLLVLAKDEGGWRPFIDGLWLDGSRGPVNPAVPLAELAQEWQYRGSVQSMVADIRRIAARPAAAS